MGSFSHWGLAGRHQFGGFDQEKAFMKAELEPRRGGGRGD